MMKGMALLGLVAVLTGCASNRDYVRQEMAEGANYINRTCGGDRECRQRLEAAEMMRIDADLQERSARRNRFAAAMRQLSENQARIAAAQAAQPVYAPTQPQVIRPTMTNCQRSGNGMSCQTY